MFKGIHDQPRRLNRPPPQRGSNGPSPLPSIILTSRIHKEPSFYRLGVKPYEAPVLWALFYVCGAACETQTNPYSTNITLPNKFSRGNRW